MPLPHLPVALVAAAMLILPNKRLRRGFGWVLLFLGLALSPLLLTTDRPIDTAAAHLARWMGEDPEASPAPTASRDPAALPQPAPRQAPEAPLPSLAVGPHTAGPQVAGAPRPPSQADVARASWSWTRARSLAAQIWEVQLPGSGRYTSFYCDCPITRRGASGGDVDLAACGYSVRRSQVRAERLEWEHVVPASRIGAGRSCWTHGAPACVRDGAPFRGRACCELADPEYNMAANDPVNLVPSVGEINADRSNHPFVELSGPPGAHGHSYGRCTMKIDMANGRVEPPRHRRGDIARISAYMSQAYRIPFTPQEAETFLRWMAEDPVSEEEIRINRAIEALGHRPNHLVLGP